MSAEVIPLAVHRSVKPALDLVKVEAGMEGQVYLTVVDGEGQPVELVFRAEEQAEFRTIWDAAMRTARHLADTSEAHRG